MSIRTNTHPTNEGNLKMFVLDVLQHDAIEQLPSILNMLNNEGCIGWREFWPCDFAPDDVVPALKQLAEQELVEVLHEPGDGNRLVPLTSNEFSAVTDLSGIWFALTTRGRDLWSKWEPPTVDSTRPPAT